MKAFLRVRKLFRRDMAFKRKTLGANFHKFILNRLILQFKFTRSPKFFLTQLKTPFLLRIIRSFLWLIFFVLIFFIRIVTFVLFLFIYVLSQTYGYSSILKFSKIRSEKFPLLTRFVIPWNIKFMLKYYGYTRQFRDMRTVYDMVDDRRITIETFEDDYSRGPFKPDNSYDEILFQRYKLNPAEYKFASKYLNSANDKTRVFKQFPRLWIPILGLREKERRWFYVRKNLKKSFRLTRRMMFKLIIYKTFWKPIFRYFYGRKLRKRLEDRVKLKGWSYEVKHNMMESEERKFRFIYTYFFSIYNICHFA